MVRSTGCALLTVIAAGVALAQAPPGSPAFEVASIKPAAPQTGRKVSLGG